MDQIAKQLKSGTLDAAADQHSLSDVQDENDTSLYSQLDNEKLNLLELERREIIGEIIKLNPGYKAPSDYKPLMKEATVAIPIKEYSGYNFLGLILGPGGDTQKRLEKETGAKIKVCGTRANTGEKVEISPRDGNEIIGAYEELYVSVSAETFEKVDAAVTVIELLVTSVSGNLGATSASPSVSGVHSSVSSSAAIDHAMAQQIGSSQASPHGPFQFPGAWFPAGPNQNPVYQLLNSSAPILNNPMPIQPSLINSSNMPSLFGPRPAPGFNSILPNTSLPPSSQPPMQVLPHPYMPQTSPLSHGGPSRNFPMHSPLPSSGQASMSGPLPFSGNQPQPIGPVPTMRPPPFAQTMSGLLPRLSDQSLTPTGRSGPSARPVASVGPSNMGQLPPPIVPSLGPRPLTLQPGNGAMALPSTISAANMVSPATFPSGLSNPQLSGAPLNHPAAPVFIPGPSSIGPSHNHSAPLHQIPLSVPRPATNMGHSSLNPSANSVTGLNPVPSRSQPSPLHASSNSVYGTMTNFTSVNPSPAAAAAQPLPNSVDFTFQTQQTQNVASQMAPRPSIQPASPIAPPSRPMVQAPAHQAPSIGMPMPSATSQTAIPVFPRPQLSNQMGQPRHQLSSTPYASNPAVMSIPPRFPAYQNAGPPLGNPVSLLGPRNYGSAPQMLNIPAPFPPRQGNQMQSQQNYLPNPRLQNPVNQNQHFPGKQVPTHPGGQQIYDPFSPTSTPVVPIQQQGGNLSNARKQENDPEYEDLMAAVGVK